MEQVKELMPFMGPNGREAVCRIEIVPLEDGRNVVIVEELDDNPGMSVSSAWEAVVATVRRKYHIPITGTVWIEHNEEECAAGGRLLGRWQLVTFKAPKKGPLQGEATWRNMNDDDWHELGLPPRR